MKFDVTEARARELCERAGVAWARANQSAWYALADREESQVREHDPLWWQAGVAVLCIFGGLGVMVWVLAFGGLR